MNDTERWPLVLQRDRSAQFVYAVKSTGVYCRPSCPSRRPRPENVRFFDSAQQAEKAGFRPCRRCQPRDPVPARAQLVRDLCRYLEANSDRRVSLTELGEFASMSHFHLQREFQAELGVSPRQYQQALRDRQSIKPRESVTYGFFTSQLGSGLVAATDKGVCAVSFGPDIEVLKEWLRNELPWAELQEGEVSQHAAEVIRAIDTGRSEVPLDIRGTVFQRKVWEALRAIPVGETRTYEELAEMTEHPAAVRAAGTACGSNRIAVLIPCHRAKRKDGGLGGYRWGLGIKQELLERESSLCS